MCATKLASACLPTVLVAVVAAFLVGPSAASAIPRPAQDPFYAYTDATPLASIAPGTVLKTRTVKYRISGIALPLKAIQLLYRSTGTLGEPTVNATTVLRAPYRIGAPKLISYQSFYDSLSRNDEPSYAIAGGVTLGGAVSSVETALIVPFLLQGYSVVIPDTEGQAPDFAAGPEYGMNTLDSLRATYASPATGVPAGTKVGMIGYSGGAIATGWAAELGPRYAPEVNQNIIGAAEGGVLVDPAHNLHYIDGSSIWAGVLPMAVIGISRAFQIDLTPYLSPYGMRILEKLHDASIINALGQYPGLTWAKMAKPQYATPEDVPIYVKVVNKLIMGSYGTPTTPMFIGQGAHGELEGTKGDQPGIGRGDGVMVAGDVRALANKYCAAGATIYYRQYDFSSHVTSVAAWLPAAYGWLTRRFAGQPAPSNCGQIAPGNSLDPIPEK